MAIPRRILVPVALTVVSFLIAAGLLGYLFSLPSEPDPGDGQLASFYRTISNTCTQSCAERVDDARKCAETCDCIVAGIRERVPQGRLADAVSNGDDALGRELVARVMPEINRQCRQPAR